MYENGIGVPQNHAEAHRWLSLAAARFPETKANLREPAREKVAGVAAQMTPAELAQAEELARDWRAP